MIISSGSYEHGVTVKGEPYLIMEWVEGLGLNYLVETGARSSRAIASIT